MKIIYILIGLIFLNINSFNLASKDYIFRRIRYMETEEEVVNHFVQQLRYKLNNSKILGIYLIPRDLREEEERIDIIIIYDGLKKEEVLNEANEISDHIFDEYGEEIIPIAVSTGKFEKYFPSSILWQIFQAGSNLYLNPEGKELFIEVSEKYINSAEEKLDKGEFESSFFALYHAALVLLNATIGEAEGYPTERPDIFEQFRENFILTEKVPADWDEKIDRLRELNERLNQNPDIAIDKKELTSLIDFLRELYLYIKD